MNEARRPKTTVLVADDNEAKRSLITDSLAGAADLELIGEARDGSEAVGLVGRLDPDVVLMDLRMPVLGGVDAIRRLRQEEGYEGRILAMADHQQGSCEYCDVDAPAASAAGADAVFVDWEYESRGRRYKPLDDLPGAIAGVLEGRRIVQPHDDVGSFPEEPSETILSGARFFVQAVEERDRLRGELRSERERARRLQEELDHPRGSVWARLFGR